ncbi:MAG: glycosyltransferase family 39 protein, partial [Proteobacteria bacterium]|nr:glycosyltransferase family 39 protein [Pseudomonadota bacterium]
MRPRSLAVRLVLGAGLWIAAALAAGGYLLSALFTDSVERGFDSRLNVMIEAFVAVSEVGPGNTLRLTQTPPSSRFRQPFSGWYWQIADANGPVLRSRSLWDQALETRDAGTAGGGEGTAPFETTGPGRRTIRVLQRTISLPGSDQTYIYTIAGDIAAMDADIAAFNAALSWSLAALGLVLVIAVFVQVRYGLRPLARIEAALGAIRSGSAHRLEGEFPSEINPLATEINALLEQNAAVLKRARTHVGNLAHALKTPLAVLGNEAARAEGPLADWKNYIRFHVVSQLAPYLSNDFVDEDFAFFGKTLQGTEELRPRWKRIISQTSRSMGEALGQVYVERAFPPQTKQRADKMIEDLRANSYVPPAFSSYNGGEIPFAYPPLGFYLGALLSALPGIDTLRALQLLPLAASTLTVAAVYPLARRLLRDDRTALLAVLAFALLPRAYNWEVMGGGVTRGVGLLFAVLALSALYDVYARNERRPAPLAGLLL